MSYIDARKEIYLPYYVNAVKEKEQFKELQQRLFRGENLLIVEVDGPHQESLPYYQKKYSVKDNFIIDHTMLATKDSLDLMLNDSLHPFGHGYCLAYALL